MMKDDMPAAGPSIAPFALVTALAFAVLAGCNSVRDPLIPGPPAALPDSVAPASTPANLLARAEATLEFESITEYEKLLTADFRFHFSAQADPELATLHPDGWTRADEVDAASHLFVGHTDDQGTHQPGATRIALVLAGTSIVDHPHPDSAAWYKIAEVPAFDAVVELADGTRYEVSAPHELHLVRGDHATLAAGQEARADLWYVVRWTDQAVALGGPVADNAVATTWGSLKAQYR